MWNEREALRFPLVTDDEPSNVAIRNVPDMVHRSKTFPKWKVHDDGHFFAPSAKGRNFGLELGHEPLWTGTSEIRTAIFVGKW